MVTGLIAANVISIKTTDQQIAHSTAESVKYEQKLQKTLEERKTKQEEQSRIAATVTPEPSQKPVAQVPAPKPIQPAPKPQNTPQAVAGGSCELANGYAWPVAVARAICMAESGGVPTKKNLNDNHGKCIGSYGLMQNACFWPAFFGYPFEALYNPSVNMDIAYKIYVRSGGFSPWTTYTSGAYLKYMR